MEDKELTLTECIKCEVDKELSNVISEGINTNNVAYLGALIDINKDISQEKYYDVKKEVLDMRMYDGYRDNYDDMSYGRRRRDSRGRYMGKHHAYDMIDQMGRYYGKYVDDMETYGHDSETEKSFDKMVECLEGFAYSVMEEANDPTKIEKIRKVARRISEM